MSRIIKKFYLKKILFKKSFFNNMSYISGLYDVALFLIKHNEEITKLNYYYNIVSFTYSSLKTTYNIGNFVYTKISPALKEEEMEEIRIVNIDGNSWVEVIKKDDDYLELP